MNRLLNTVPLKTLAVIISTIRDQELFGEADAQNLGNIYGDFQAALAGYNFPSFEEKWFLDNEESDKKLDPNAQNLEKNWEEVSKTLELVYILALGNLLVINHTRQIMESFNSKQAYIDACVSKSFDLTKRAVFEVYTEDNDLPYITLPQAQKTISILASRLMDRVNLQVFEDLSKWYSEKVDENQTDRIINVGDTLLWWGLELNAEFRDAPNVYI